MTKYIALSKTESLTLHLQMQHKTYVYYLLLQSVHNNCILFVSFIFTFYVLTHDA